MSERTFESDDQIVEEGNRIERHRYWDHVKMIAQEALDEYPGREDDRGERDDYIHDSVDRDRYILYTTKNLTVLRFTENDSAYQDAGLTNTEDAYAVYQQVAFFAMRQDVQDELQRLIDALPDADEEAEDEEDDDV